MLLESFESTQMFLVIDRETACATANAYQIELQL